MDRSRADNHPPRGTTGGAPHVHRLPVHAVPLNPLLSLGPAPQGGAPDKGLTEPGELLLGRRGYVKSRRPIRSSNHCGAA